MTDDATKESVATQDRLRSIDQQLLNLLAERVKICRCHSTHLDAWQTNSAVDQTWRAEVAKFDLEEPAAVNSSTTH